MRVATDIGGTFTDLVYVDDQGVVGVAKSHTTPPNFEQGIIDVIKKSEIDQQTIETFIHGTTVIINALTERKGVKTGLITTQGFRDVLEIGRGNRPDLFNVRYKKPAVCRRRPFQLERFSFFRREHVIVVHFSVEEKCNRYFECIRYFF